MKHKVKFLKVANAIPVKGSIKGHINIENPRFKGIEAVLDDEKQLVFVKHSDGRLFVITYGNIEYIELDPKPLKAGEDTEKMPKALKEHMKKVRKSA